MTVFDLMVWGSWSCYVEVDVRIGLVQAAAVKNRVIVFVLCYGQPSCKDDGAWAHNMRASYVTFGHTAQLYGNDKSFCLIRPGKHNGVFP